MRRRQPSISAEQAQKLWNAPTTTTSESVTVQCRLVTPMYGGGVHAGEVDKAMPIRASGIRGQLRCWWRLLHDDGRTSEKLFQDECELWGGIASSGPKASKIALRVACKSAASFVGKGDMPPYALILESSDDPKLLKPSYCFDLRLSFNPRVTSKQREQVIRCLRWWANFGGIGARTRRGLGAFKASSDEVALQPVSSDDVKEWGGWMMLGPPKRDAGLAWKDAVGTLQSYRQGQGVGRKSGARGRPGGSNWPEADAIRGLADAAKPTPDGEAPFFPRAAFGLPIVFQFKGEKRLNDTLEGEDHERMASPLILRPYFDGRDYRPMALLLPNWEKRISVVVAMKERGSIGPAWPSNEDDRKRQAKEVIPMRSRGSDSLTAFMHYFSDCMNTKQGR